MLQDRLRGLSFLAMVIVLSCMAQVCLFPPMSPLWQHQHYVIAFMLQNTWDGHNLALSILSWGSLLYHSSNCSRSYTFISQIDYSSVFWSHQLNYSAGCQLTKQYQALVPLVQCISLRISRAIKKAKKTKIGRDCKDLKWDDRFWWRYAIGRWSPVIGCEWRGERREHTKSFHKRQGKKKKKMNVKNTLSYILNTMVTLQI